MAFSDNKKASVDVPEKICIDCDVVDIVDYKNGQEDLI